MGKRTKGPSKIAIIQSRYESYITYLVSRWIINEG